MSNNPIVMTKLRTIIRLYEDRIGLKTIATLARTSRNTVKKYILIYQSLGLTYQDFLSKSDSELNQLFCISGEPITNPRMVALDERMPAIVKKLSKKGMTTLKLWQEYIEEHPSGYGLTQFRIAVQRYRMINNPSMRMEHKAGDKMFIDYTGSKLWIYPHGEQPREVEVFVSILGCSLLTYVEASESQSKEDLITACENALYYYGGVPQAIVPDNLKSAVTKASRYEAIINSEFERFAEHYGLVVLPTRVRKPKDKSHVENAVKLTYREIFTALEGLHCPNLASLNAAIRRELERYNNQLLSRRNYSRRGYFEEIEQETLRPLNPIRYEIKKSLMATVDKYGYVRLKEDIHYYSVPHTYIGKKLKIAYTASDVEIYDSYDCIATHTRCRLEFKYTTNPDHLSPKHKALADWSPEKFISEARSIHEDVEHYIRKVIEKKRYPEQANKCCSGILNFARKVGVDRLVAACRLADSYGRYNFVEIQDILTNNLEGLELSEQPVDLPEHENIRGREYYK